MRRTVLLVALLFVARATFAAPDPREQAKKHYAAGEARWKAGNYRGAIIEFTAADELAPSPVLSYNVALCHDKLGQREDAVRHYREYLSRWPEAPNRAEVEARIAALAVAVPEPAPAATPTPSPELREPRPGIPEARPPADSDVRTPQAMKPGETPAPTYDRSFANRIPGPAEAAPTEPPGSSGPPGPYAPGPGEPPPTPAPSRPFYAQWWFWVIVGVGVAITVDIAVSSSKNNSVGLTQGAQTATPAGLTFHF